MIPLSLEEVHWIQMVDFDDDSETETHYLQSAELQILSMQWSSEMKFAPSNGAIFQRYDAIKLRKAFGRKFCRKLWLLQYHHPGMIWFGL